MPYIGKKPADIIATAVDTTTGTFSGDIDVDGTTNLDVVDIDGAVDMASTLQVDGAITSSAGATITTADNTDQLTLVSTDADANVGPSLNLYRNSGSPADSDLAGIVNFTSRNDNSQDFTVASLDASVIDVTDGTEDGRFRIKTMTGGALKTVSFVGGNMTVSDSQEVRFGNAADLKIYHDGTDSHIDNDTGDLTLDVAGNILLDADGAIWKFQDGGTEIFQINSGSQNANLKSTVQDKDIRFQGNDGGATITALTLDMSDAGAATLNNGLTLTDGNLVVANGHGIDFSAASGSASGSSSALLDDYEEGTVEVTLAPSTSGTITVSSTNKILSYTKVGRMVTMTGAIVVDSVSSPVGTQVTLSGLPFTMGDFNGLAERGNASVTFFDQSVGDYIVEPGFFFNGTSFRIYRPANTWAGADSFNVNFSYFT